MALDRTPVTLGGDPEVFLQRDGKLIGAERVIPEAGWVYGGYKLVRDGVQAEFQFGACEDSYDVGRAIYHTVSHFDEWLEINSHKGVKFDWTECLDVPLDELVTLGEKARDLGCEPSLNYYEGTIEIKVPPLFPTRSAGGHIHLGLPSPIWNNRPGQYRDERRPLVPMLDWVVGNTAVLLNRGEHQVKRRELYGRAGEFRLPDYGLEYRVPSNFWLRDYVLIDFIFGLTEFTVDAFYTCIRRQNKLDDELMKGFEVQNCRTAIDRNDYGQALANFETIVPFIEEHARAIDPLNKETLKHFRKFLSVGIDDTLPVKGIEKRWSGFTEEHTWDRFIKKF